MLNLSIVPAFIIIFRRYPSLAKCYHQRLPQSYFYQPFYAGSTAGSVWVSSFLSSCFFLLLIMKISNLIIYHDQHSHRNEDMVLVGWREFLVSNMAESNISVRSITSWLIIWEKRCFSSSWGFHDSVKLDVDRAISMSNICFPVVRSRINIASLLSLLVCINMSRIPWCTLGVYRYYPRIIGEFTN